MTMRYRTASSAAVILRLTLSEAVILRVFKERIFDPTQIPSSVLPSAQIAMYIQKIAQRLLEVGNDSISKNIHNMKTPMPHVIRINE